MHKVLIIFLAALSITGCLAIVDHQGDVSRVKTFIITDDEALDLLDRAEMKNPDEKHEIGFFKGE